MSDAAFRLNLEFYLQYFYILLPEASDTLTDRLISKKINMTEYQEYLQKEPNYVLAKQLKTAAWIITVAVLGLVVGMRYIRLDFGMEFDFLPPFHATLNALAAVALIFSVIQIKAKKVEAHKKGMLTALGLSVGFLLSYVLYHITSDPVLYGGEGTIRYVYFFFLITHVVLAAVSFPFILFTFIYSWTNQFAKHRKMARRVFPVWLYVAVTGPICYLMLAPYY